MNSRNSTPARQRLSHWFKWFALSAFVAVLLAGVALMDKALVGDQAMGAFKKALVAQVKEFLRMFESEGKAA